MMGSNGEDPKKVRQNPRLHQVNSEPNSVDGVWRWGSGVM